MFKKVTIIVLDSMGVGALPDAAEYGDEGSNTFANIVKGYPNILIPNLASMGIFNISGLEDLSLAIDDPIASYGRLAEQSIGKDTITGHWEMAGVITDTPFLTFKHFPDDFIAKFEEAIGVGTLGNVVASGTEIIEELGPEHEKTGKPIIYTSADSVLQIAVNTAVIPLARLYEICEIAREMLVGPVLVGRVIARPYEIQDGKRVRTSDRKDYSISPPCKTLLDNIEDAGLCVTSIGKISDIFSGQGITENIHTVSNENGTEITIDQMKNGRDGLIFTNLVDFDSKYGHRRDVPGYAQAIERFDAYLPQIIDALGDDDLLILCADHGNDPAHKGTDHTREHVPLLVYGKRILGNHNLGTRSSFADLGATVAEALNVAKLPAGESFLQEILIK